jgi:hypothetical protein
LTVRPRNRTKNNVTIQKRETGILENPLIMLRSSVDIATSTPQMIEPVIKAKDRSSKWSCDPFEICIDLRNIAMKAKTDKRARSFIRKRMLT